MGLPAPQNVVQGLLARIVHPQLGMEEKLLAVAFMDMQNFTTMCESVEAQEIVAVSCQLFDVCCGRGALAAPEKAVLREGIRYGLRSL